MKCIEKIRYGTLRGAAEAALEQIVQHGPLRSYACDRCSGYHLTTAPLRGSGSISEEQVRALVRALGGGR